MSKTNRKAKVVTLTQPLPEALQHLAANVATLRASGFESLTEAAIFCEAMGEPKTLAEIVKAVGLPFSTASRIAWNLAEERGLLTYAPHPTDRRKKLIRANVERLA